jgi:hypothetical protein
MLPLAIRFMLGCNCARHVARDPHGLRRRHNFRVFAEAERPARDFVEIAHGKDDSGASPIEQLDPLCGLPAPADGGCSDVGAQLDGHFCPWLVRLDEPQDIVRSISSGNPSRGVVRSSPQRS